MKVCRELGLSPEALSKVSGMGPSEIPPLRPCWASRLHPGMGMAQCRQLCVACWADRWFGHAGEAREGLGCECSPELLVSLTYPGFSVPGGGFLSETRDLRCHQ